MWLYTYVVIPFDSYRDCCVHYIIIVSQYYILYNTLHMHHTEAAEVKTIFEADDDEDLLFK